MRSYSMSMAFPELLRFHLRAGGRVAVRMLTPVAVASVAAAVLYANPTAVLSLPAAVLFPPVVSLGSAFVAAGVAIGTSASLGPRLTCGLLGWNRHLPVSAVTQRRAATAGLVSAQAPIVVLVALAGILAAYSDSTAAVSRLLGIPVWVWSGALAALRVRPCARLLAGLSAASSFTGAFAGLAVAVLLTCAAEMVAGGVIEKRIGGGSVRILRSTRGPFVMQAVITARAVGWRVISHLSAALVIVIPLSLFLVNNQLNPAQQIIAVRTAGLLAGGLVMLTCAESVARRRPPWPWARSLPISASRRIALDAGMLAILGAPVVVGSGLCAPSALPSMVAAVPLLAVLGAKAIRVRPDSFGGVTAGFLAEILLVTGAVALIPFSWLLMIGLAPIAHRSAVSADRGQDVSRWHELHHLAAGDTQSWSEP